MKPLSQMAGVILILSGCCEHTSTPGQHRADSNYVGKAASTVTTTERQPDYEWRMYAIQEAMHDWQVYLKPLAPGASSRDVEAMMKGKYRDKAEFVLGGSGNYTLFYLIDDVLEIRFEFLVQDHLFDTPKVEKSRTWLKTPDGRLIADPYLY